MAWMIALGLEALLIPTTEVTDADVGPMALHFRPRASRPCPAGSVVDRVAEPVLWWMRFLGSRDVFEEQRVAVLETRCDKLQGSGTMVCCSLEGQSGDKLV